MAYNNSEQIAVGDSYQLGEYTFTINTTVSEGERVIQAHCSGPEGSAAKGISVPTTSQLEGWYVEANETEASVYALIKKAQYEPVELEQPAVLGVAAVGDIISTFTDPETIITEIEGSAYVFRMPYTDGWTTCVAVSSSPCTIRVARRNGSRPGAIILRASTYKGRTAYVGSIGTSENSIGWPWPISASQPIGAVNAAIVLITDSDSQEDSEEKLIARFAIDFGEAGGGGWSEPGDTEDIEPDEPTHTLYLTVTGALSGRHNDPLNDTSYSYIPTDKDTVKFYGCGGDGGHGGGGGGGASTVVIQKFATNRASSKEITVFAKRHGYGSGGGKGGTGGDGCVLIYY